MEGKDVVPIPMKCKKCRYTVLEHPKVPVEDSHGEPFPRSDLGSVLETNNKEPCVSEVWYVPEDSMPQWMTTSMERGDWVKGKIMCPKCDARIGSYSFVSGYKCPCGSRVVPPIHIVKSKVDFTVPYHIPMMMPSSSK